jgi:hypothetical protein
LENDQILVVSSNRNVQRHIIRALASAGFGTKTLPLDRDQVSLYLPRPWQMCIVDADDKQQEVRWLLNELYNKYKDVICLMVSNDHQNPFLREHLTSHDLNNVIAKHGGVAASSEMIDETELIVTCQKLFNEDIFGIEKYLPSWAIKIYEHKIKSTEQKRQIIDELEEYLLRIDCFDAVKNAVLLVADELIMNAIFNAPRDIEGNPKYADLDRADRLDLEPNETVTFRYACDGKNIALSVKDQFGSLDRDVILEYLKRGFRDEGPAEIEEDRKGGAGLGLYLVFSSITQLTFNIHAGVSTEVIAMFYARSGGRAFKASGRSLNLFVLQ